MHTKIPLLATVEQSNIDWSKKSLDFFLKSAALPTAGRFPYNFNVYNESNCFVVNTVKTAIVSMNFQFI